MRIGQILQEAELITAKQLTEALEYSSAKGIFLGRAVILLKFVQEPDVDRSLQAQRLIKLGLSPLMAVEALQTAVRDGVDLEQALQGNHKQTLAAAKAAEPPPPPPLLEDASCAELLASGDSLLIEDRCQQAEERYKRARAILEQQLGTDHIDLVPILVRLGNAYMALLRFDNAQLSYEKVLEIRTASLPENHPQIARALESLADLHKARGEDEKAMATALSALDILERNLPSQLGAYAAILRRLAASAHITQEQKDRPMPVGELLRAAGLISDKELEMSLRMSKSASLPLGIVLRENCVIEDRELQSALKAQFCIRQGILSEQLAIDLLARAYRRNISLERLLHEASVMVSDETQFAIYRQIAADLDKLVSAESSSISTQTELAPVAYRLGSLYEQVQDRTQAEIYYSRALKIWGAAISGDLTVAKTCVSLAKIYAAQARREEAVELLLKALEHRQQVLGTSHEETIEVIEEIAEHELEMRNTSKALDFSQQALRYREELGQDGMSLLRAVMLLADCFAISKRYEEAQSTLKRAMALTQTDSKQPTPALAAVMEKQGDLNKKQGLIKAAIPLYKSALMILQACGKKDSPSYESLQSKIAQEEDKLKNAISAKGD